MCLLRIVYFSWSCTCMSILSLDMPTTSQRSPRSLSSLPAHETLAGECQQTRRNLTFSNPDLSWHGFSSFFQSRFSFKVIVFPSIIFPSRSLFFCKTCFFLSNSSLSSKLVYFLSTHRFSFGCVRSITLFLTGIVQDFCIATPFKCTFGIP